MMQTTATTSESRPATRKRLRPGTRHFLRHLGEMMLAMFLGMAVLGGVAEGLFAIAGSSLTETPAAFHASLMAFNMTVPMVAWMARRGHPAARSAEMAGAMIVPTAAAIALDVVGAIGPDAVLALQHAVMIPAMVAVMLWRREHYAH